ncbi:MAG: (d)CMP kinase [Gammaproteobacteria bacterium]|nr:(d)CMP kinase [Gammaproteobacteria bacterium]
MTNFQGLPPVLTIDGPSGSGKGTIVKHVAQRLGWHMLDSGALYRLVAYGSQQNHLSFEDENAIAEYAAQLDVEFKLVELESGIETGQNGQDLQIILEGKVVGSELRTETTGNAASIVAAMPKVREALLQRQRDFRQNPGLVADGRDMGTTVFPDAEAKIFLTASAEERAQRRYKQLKEKGISGNLAALLQDIRRDINERDERDSQRSASPLKPAEDAILIDTSGLSIEQVVEQVMAVCEKSFDVK